MSLAKHGSVEEKCDVAGCENAAERSINIKQAARSNLKMKTEGLRSVHLCKEHYKDYKKQTKQDRELDQVYRWSFCFSVHRRACRRRRGPRHA